jgi:TonB family protein
MLSAFDTDASSALVEHRRGLALGVASMIVLASGLLVIGLPTTRTSEIATQVGEIEAQELQPQAVVKPEPPAPPKETPPAEEPADAAPEPAAEAAPAVPDPEDAQPVAAPAVAAEPQKVQAGPLAESERSTGSGGARGGRSGRGRGGSGEGGVADAPVDIGDRDAPRVPPKEAQQARARPDNVRPVYPEGLRKRNITGTVVLRLQVSKEGAVVKAIIVDKSCSVDEATDPELHALAIKLLVKAAVDAVRVWTYDPATLHGQTLATWVQVTIPFVLN